MALGIKFTGRVDNRGTDNPCAWLEDGEMCEGGFWMNECNLQIRIDNTKAGLGGVDTDTSPEELALEAIRIFAAKK